MSVLEDPFPPSLVLTPTSLWPTTLPEETVEAVLQRPMPRRPREVRVPSAKPLVSIIVVTFNNLVYTRLCLESILANTEYPNYEVVAVDNASADNTPQYLQGLARLAPLRVLVNEHNRGFAAANNQGLDAARGDVLVLLNNDTIVSPGWLDTLVERTQDAAVGMVGPVTNSTSNGAQIPASYRTYGEFLGFAQEYAAAHAGQCFEIPMLTMFCLAMPRETYRRLGGLDERFGIGMFEDDDYAARARAQGLRVICCEDVFVHHFGQASFGKLTESGAYGDLFEANRRLFEEKWGCAWTRPRHRVDDEYLEMVGRIQAVVRQSLPPDAAVSVASKGDEELLRLGVKSAIHFPSNPEGEYAGSPDSQQELLEQLRQVSAKGSHYFLLPRTLYWWLTLYVEFCEYLHKTCRIVVESDACQIYAFPEGTAP